MHENDRRFHPRVVPDVDPVLVPPHNALVVGHYSLRTGCHLTWDLRDDVGFTVPDPFFLNTWGPNARVQGSLEKTGRSDLRFGSVTDILSTTIDACSAFKSKLSFKDV